MGETSHGANILDWPSSSKLDASLLRLCERCHDALRHAFGFVLRPGPVDLQHDATGVWRIDDGKFDVAVHHRRNERQSSRQPVDQGDDEGRSAHSANSQRLAQLHPRALQTGANLRKLGDELSAAPLDKSPHSGGLGVEAQA
ncbi:MAG: hypothetical protein ABSF49_12985 [Roseiarcus sp.]